MSVLQTRIAYFSDQVASLRNYELLTSKEISALRQDEVRRLERQAPAGMPPLSARQIDVLRKEYELDGHPTRRGSKREDGFCGAVHRYQRRQLRLAAQTAMRHARALRKLDRSYVERPGVSV